MSVNVAKCLCIIFLQNQKGKSIIQMGFLDELFSAGVWGEKTPTTPKWKKWIHRNLSDNHCPECLMLDGCWFLKEKNTQMATPSILSLHLGRYTIY